MFPPDWFEEKAENRELIGAIVTTWSGCEHAMFDQISWARAIPSIAAQKISWPIQIATKRLINQWEQVAKLLFSEFCITDINIDSISTRLYDMADWRNLIVHGFYDQNGKTGVSTVTLPRWDDRLGVLVYEPFEIDTNTLQLLHKTASDILEDVVWCDEAIIAVQKERSAIGSKDPRPAPPEILYLPPKRVQVARPL